MVDDRLSRQIVLDEKSHTVYRAVTTSPPLRARERRGELIPFFFPPLGLKRPFLIGKSIDRSSVTGTDCRWNCAKSYNGRPTACRLKSAYGETGTKYTLKPLKTFASFVRFACKPETIQSQCGIIYPRDIVNNVTFVSIA